MTLTYDWTVTIDGVNVSALVKAGGTIDYGRPTTNTAFSAPTAVFEMFTETTFPNYAGAWPTITLGDPVIIHVTWDGVTQWRRFTGVVQALDWNPAGLRVTAAGTSADWQNITADGLEFTMTPYTIPVTDETETTRVDRIADDASVSIVIEGVPARRVRAIPAGELAQPVLDAILRVADDCDALLLEDRLGQVRYRTRNFDRPAPYTLPPDVVERDSIDMAYERGTHINAVRVFYGEPDPDTGQQPYVYENDDSTYGTVSSGERLAELYTDIQYDDGARGKARVYLEKHRLEWSMPDVVLLMNQATGAEADDILDLQENWMVTVDPLPDGCPITSYDGDILGFTDIMHETDYRIILHLGPRIADTGGVPEEPIFPEDSITGGTTSTYEDEFGFLWQLHEWESAGSYTFTVNNDVTCDVVAIAGGGGGGNGTGIGVAGAGGGAGTMFDYELAFTTGTVAVTVGAGGSPGTNGSDTTIAGVVCKGGGYGGGGNGGNGGSGGGATNGYYDYGDKQGGSLDSGATYLTVAPFYCGNGNADSGGGAGGDAGYYSAGPGRSSDITGTTVVYAAGSNHSAGYGGTPGSGGSGADGFGGPAAAAGVPGAVYLRYRIG